MPSILLNGQTSSMRSAGGFLSTRGASWLILAGTIVSGNAAVAQDGVPKRASGASTSRPVSDSLRFANGLLRQKKYELAAQEYEQILKAGATAGERDDARFGLGNAWLSVGRYREARGAFDDFLRDAPKDPRARFGPVSFRRVVVSSWRASRGSRCARGVYRFEGRASVARARVDLSGRHLFRA